MIERKWHIGEDKETTREASLSWYFKEDDVPWILKKDDLFSDKEFIMSVRVCFLYGSSIWHDFTMEYHFLGLKSHDQLTL